MAATAPGSDKGASCNSTSLQGNRDVRKINLNADFGEGFDDGAVIAAVASVNLACGAHAGDEATMAAVCRLARGRGVGIGAHPGFADREGFGRRAVEMDAAALEALIHSQIVLCQRIAAGEGVAVDHVKAHGALYNMAADRADYAQALVRAVQRADPALIVLGLPDCAMAAAARDLGMRYAAEAFADRGYRAGRLIPRGEAGDLILDPTLVGRAALDRAGEGAASICVHGDKPGAGAIAAAARQALEGAGYAVVPLPDAIA
jgi:5-oxoprolinase (ATP-hydrolysing) subunit A